MFTEVFNDQKLPVAACLLVFKVKPLGLSELGHNDGLIKGNGLKYKPGTSQGSVSPGGVGFGAWKEKMDVFLGVSWELYLLAAQR